MIKNECLPLSSSLIVRSSRLFLGNRTGLAGRHLLCLIGNFHVVFDGARIFSRMSFWEPRVPHSRRGTLRVGALRQVLISCIVLRRIRSRTERLDRGATRGRQAVRDLRWVCECALFRASDDQLANAPRRHRRRERLVRKRRIIFAECSGRLVAVWLVQWDRCRLLDTYCCSHCWRRVGRDRFCQLMLHWTSGWRVAGRSARIVLNRSTGVEAYK